MPFYCWQMFGSIAQKKLKVDILLLEPILEELIISLNILLKERLKYFLWVIVVLFYLFFFRKFQISRAFDSFNWNINRIYRSCLFFSTAVWKNNRKFKCLKISSIHINQEADTVQATKADQRVTRVGEFLRRTSLDEFPQFINVLIVEMSLVGTRPHMIKHTTDYS